MINVKDYQSPTSIDYIAAVQMVCVHRVIFINV